MVHWRGILGFENGVVQAPMGPDMGSPELVAAVANAGSLGFLKAPDWEDPDYMRRTIKKTKSLTKKPFGVGIIVFFPHEENLKVIIEEKVGVLQLSWGDVDPNVVARCHATGIKVVPQVGTVDQAKQAIDAGVDGLIVQGYEAGGHIIGKETLFAIVPRVVELVGNRNIPVIAAGSIIDGRGYVAALALGAKGAALGTRFLTTKESFAHPLYKEWIVEYTETAYTDMYGRARWLPNTHHRTLATPFFKFWDPLPAYVNEDGQPIIAHGEYYERPTDVPRFAGTVPNKTITGKVEDMAMYAGQGTPLIHEILTAEEVIKRVVEGAKDIIKRISHD